MQSEAIQGLVESQQQLAEDAIRREDEADMMYWLAIRLLVSAQNDHTIADKIGLEEPSAILYYALITKYLEIIADHAENIARRAIEFMALNKEKTSRYEHVMNQILNISDLTHTVFIKAMDSVFTRDFQVANNVLEISKIIRKEHVDLLKELTELPILRTIILELARIADTGAGIAVIAINKALEKPSKICSVAIS
jgi:phosphate uptake regulator